MTNLIHVACNCGKYITTLSKQTGWQDIAITVVLCITIIVVAYKVCNTIVELIMLNHIKKDKAIKGILKDILGTDQDVIDLLKQKLEASKDTKS